MPIEYRIDHRRRVVLARGHGTVNHEDVFGYQRDVWSRRDVAGYDELVDMSDVKEIVLSSPDRVRELASLSADMDAAATASRFAIVAPEDFAFGLGRMYEAYRELNPQSTKRVSVFRSLDEALVFLGLEGLPEEA